MSADLNKVIVLKRNDDEEKRKNYKKIYDLSLIDSIKNITPDEKLLLLSTIKKILLCTNKYIDSFNKKYLLDLLELLGFYFLVYLIIFLPIFRFIVMTEEQVEYTKGYTIYIKFRMFVESHIIVVILKILDLAPTRSKYKKLNLYYARREINKIKNIFNIAIDDKTFDLKIKRNNQITEPNSEDEFYQYVICYPKYFYDIDPNIITPQESLMLELTKVTEMKVFGTIFIMKYTKILFFIGEIISFYYLSLARIMMYNVILIINIFINSGIDFYYGIKRHERVRIIQYMILRRYFKDGYFINMSDEITEIFKLNKKYEEEGEKAETDYLNIYKKIEAIHDKVNSWF